ncbi:hypothetical protein VA7868_03936 [Vibrio aerogenes CECT 7868]|uniref:Uncharacterized protein n=1 Tax=Vibrio aerogenes CECT 7868 TaxID=1216006 RepID=A0A1M6C5H1_9VIBR|nr:hypothetical protein [Vibrio aerogenes]SHI56212.1 hypothetical protein VA7868_03936 [Vibrio aerogenes CECT 7868]
MNHKVVHHSAALDLNCPGSVIYAENGQAENKPENTSCVKACQVKEEDNIIILSEHPYEILKSGLMTAYENQQEMLQAEVKKALQRLLEYKELLLHKEVLDSQVLKDFYFSMTPAEQAVADRGIEEISSAIFALDALLI